MIKIKNGQIISMNINGYKILSVYTQGQLVWAKKTINKILSCYNNGYWIDEYPWTDNTFWIDK